MTSVPAVVGQDLSTARATLASANLVAAFVEKESDEPKGTVVRTKPTGGEQVQQGGTVTVFVSDGQEQVPNVVGLPQGQAEEKIRDAGFEPQARDDLTSTLPAGTVSDQFPTDGVQAQGSTVIIFVSVYVEPPPSPTESPTQSPTDGLPTDLPSRAASPADGRTTGTAGRRTPVR